MAETIEIRLGGYAPPDSTHGRALDRIGMALRERLGRRVHIDILYNVLDQGRTTEDLVADVEHGSLTACYVSTQTLLSRVPQVAIIDFPYVFDSLEHAHSCLDGPLGTALSERTQRATGLIPCGYWDNGFRHLSNALREVRRPEDCRGLRIRLQSNTRVAERYFTSLGCQPVVMSLHECIAMLRSGVFDAQENPLANFVTYGFDEVHPFVTLTGHLFGARGVYASAAQLGEWPEDVREAFAQSVREAIVQQRTEAALKEEQLLGALERGGTRIAKLDDAERLAFQAAAEPIVAEAAAALEPGLYGLVRGSSS